MGRFSECWQFSADYPGTPEQRDMVRFAYRLVWGTKKWRLFKRLDRAINDIGRHTLIFGFLDPDMFALGQTAIAGRTGINIRWDYSVAFLYMQALHELGHVVDRLLLTDEQRLEFMRMAGIDPAQNSWNHNVQETFADAVRDCIHGLSWQQLWPLLLP